MNIIKLPSSTPGLSLEVAFVLPYDISNIKAVIQFSHGMAEHKERYFKFMDFLADNGYACVIHDHRGHGQSVMDKEDLGYFYSEDSDEIVNDLYIVNRYIHNHFKDIPVYMFAHSMGTFVARVYLQEYDDTIDKLVLCGAPVKNELSSFGVVIAKLDSLIFGKKNRSRFINFLAFAGYNKSDIKNSWISVNTDNVREYNECDHCGFIFTANGFVNLFKLSRDAFRPDKWVLNNPDLKILFIAGSKDPCIKNSKKFVAMKNFIKSRGYYNVKSKVYPSFRHELLNEDCKDEVYHDVLRFFNH